MREDRLEYLKLIEYNESMSERSKYLVNYLKSWCKFLTEQSACGIGERQKLLS